MSRGPGSGTRDPRGRAASPRRLHARRLVAASLAVAGLLLAARSAPGEPIPPRALPEPLRTWVDWVLFERTEGVCPFLDAREERWCAWPGRLELELGEAGGRFSQGWELRREEWVPLPGDVDQWPGDVRVDGRATPVVPFSTPGERREVSRRPGVRLSPGSHQVTGRFAWRELPSVLPVPAETGLVVLSLSGRTVPRPERDERGRLWLRPQAREAAPADRLEIEVQRRLVDEIPVQLDTRIELRVSGSAREQLLGRALPDGFVPMGLESSLPVRVEAGGRLRVQLRPGNWVVRLVARHGGPLAGVGPGLPAGPWAEEEVWVFEARPRLRVVNVEGGVAVDPQQTLLPAEWRQLPAYRLRAGESLGLVQRLRGDPDPPERLAVARTLWLDMDGAGLTFHDRIEGRLPRGLHLALAEPGSSLGRAAVNGRDWFLTRLEAGAPVGVELPPGSVTVEADGRLEPRGWAVPALGWDHAFERVSGRLELPPGWRLLHARGPDKVSRDWLGTWTLLDFFLVLVAASAASRLWGRGFGLLALATLALTWTEPGAPRGTWLAVLVAEALVRALGTRRIAAGARALRAVGWAALALVAVPFLVGQIQQGLFPALRPPAVVPGFVDLAQTGGRALELDKAAPQETRAEFVPRSPATEEVRAAEPPSRPASEPPDLRRLDPDARIPTGPGLPRWSWTRVDLGWSGPVEPGQELRLVLLSPALNGVLAFVRLALVAGLLFVMLRGSLRRGSGASSAGATALTTLVALGLPGLGPESARADIPPRELLDELRSRLLAPPACHPYCASLANLGLELRPGELRLRLEVHAGADTAIPLPGDRRQWEPSAVELAGVPARALRRDGDARLWLALAPGVHAVELRGPVPAGADRVELPLPLAPRRVTVDAPGWEVLGLDAEGRATGALRLQRTVPAGGRTPPRIEAAPLPPFARIERTLELGVDWRVVTRVLRLTPPGEAFVLDVPLLDGEAVTTPGVGIADGRVRVTIPAASRERSWSGSLEPRPSLRLAAPEAVPWVEAWRVEASPLWHVSGEGLPPIGVAEEDPAPAREWRPWPGESLQLLVQRPAGVGGDTLTIDASRLALRPGLRRTDATLQLELRSSQGGEHTVLLPEGAVLRGVRIDGRSQPLRAEGRQLSLPLVPASRQAEIDWESPVGIGARLRVPRFELRAPTVNLETVVTVPANRWLLWAGGPRLGPAVLFWSLLAVLAVVAAGLARLRSIPLRGYQWFLLGLGLTQVPVALAAIVPGWMLALGWRRERGARLRALEFDALQLLLAFATLAALAVLFAAVRQGLLGAPEMQVAGNGSTAAELRWYQDRAAEGSPQAVQVFSVPIAVYRLAMLAWALWLARALLGWLRWGWESVSRGGLWRRPRRSSSPGTAPSEGS